MGPLAPESRPGRQPDENVGRFAAESSDGSWSELRYHHLVPDPEQWDAMLDGRDLPRPPRATLVTDFYSYNTNLPRNLSDLVSDSHYDRKAHGCSRTGSAT